MCAEVRRRVRLAAPHLWGGSQGDEHCPLITPHCSLCWPQVDALGATATIMPMWRSSLPAPTAPRGDLSKGLCEKKTRNTPVADYFRHRQRRVVCIPQESNILSPLPTSLAGNGFALASGCTAALAASSRATSAASSLHESAPKLSLSCLRLRAPGMGIVPLATHQLMATCERVAPPQEESRLVELLLPLRHGRPPGRGWRRASPPSSRLRRPGQRRSRAGR